MEGKTKNMKPMALTETKIVTVAQSFKAKRLAILAIDMQFDGQDQRQKLLQTHLSRANNLGILESTIQGTNLNCSYCH